MAKHRLRELSEIAEYCQRLPFLISEDVETEHKLARARGQLSGLQRHMRAIRNRFWQDLQADREDELMAAFADGAGCP